MIADQKLPAVQPFKPSRIHSFFRWVDRLPGPYWLYYAGLVVAAGLLNHVVAWREQMLAPGEINLYYAMTAFFIGYYLFANDIMVRVARESLIDFQPLLSNLGSERDRIIFEFTHIPEKVAAVTFVIGAAIGFVLALMQVETAVEMNHAFPEFEVTVFTVSFGMIGISVYHVVRGLSLIKRVFDKLNAIDIFDQSSIYALSRYSGLVVVLVAVANYMTFALAPSLTALGGYYWIAVNVAIGALALTVFWLPLRAVNRKLVTEKNKLLRDVSLRTKDLLALMHRSLDQHDLTDIEKLREALEALKAEREYLESIRTWPWRPATLTGVLSAVVLPLFVGLALEIVRRLIRL